jgi:YjbE family integral membrane protein
LEILQTVDFWIGLLKIIGINVALSGDNAVVIALAARKLPPQQQKQAIALGSGAAVLLRIALTIVAAKLLAMPYLQIVGGLLLLWIGVQLLNEDEGGSSAKEQGNLMAAVRTILIADLVMSLDNVIAVAAAAKGSTLLLVLGLIISIPLVVFGSAMMIRLMQRFPVIIALGAGLVGWVAGETIISDVSVQAIVGGGAWLHYAAAAAGAVLVITAGKMLAKRARGQTAF